MKAPDHFFYLLKIVFGHTALWGVFRHVDHGFDVCDLLLDRELLVAPPRLLDGDAVPRWDAVRWDAVHAAKGGRIMLRPRASLSVTWW